MTDTQTKLADDLRKLTKLRKDYKKASDKKTALYNELQAFERQVLDRMESEDVKSVKSGRNTFTAQETIYHTITDEEAFVEWAEENDEALFEKRPRKALLNQVVRTALDDGDSLPPGLGVRVVEYVSVR